MNTEQLLKEVTQAALDLKALELVRFDLGEQGSMADHVLICHGTSTAHCRGIADKVEMILKKQGVLPYGFEGYVEGEWILLDYNDVILHIFTQDIREHFRLEELFAEFEKADLS